MKTMKFFPVIGAFVFALAFSSCQKEAINPNVSDDILPARFSVKVPASISESSEGKKAYSAQDTLRGSDIYQHLGTFIAVGDGAGEIVEGIIRGIRYYHINKPLSMTYESDEDGRAKNLVVFKEASFEDRVWDFQMNISDAESEGNDDGGLGLQIFWNTYPIEGIAILKPYNINRDEIEFLDNAVFRIDYSEAGDNGYDAEMLVSIAGLPLLNPLVDPYCMSTLKMKAAKKGDLIDVYGNSNHPNARFFTSQSGFNWAFVASADEKADVAVAEVGLPPSDLNQTSREILLKDFSIKNVFTDQIYAVWPWISQNLVNGYLYNAGAPGYFNKYGFVQGGTSPGTSYDGVEARINNLSPFNPSEISNLEINFKLN
ncbi:MAG: hypothetical protein H6540_00415 [Bacteroidales bacterium]|nr:hypothetical protein [Bacteroidales bacterium]